MGDTVSMLVKNRYRRKRRDFSCPIVASAQSPVPSSRLPNLPPIVAFPPISCSIVTSPPALFPLCPVGHDPGCRGWVPSPVGVHGIMVNGGSWWSSPAAFWCLPGCQNGRAGGERSERAYQRSGWVAAHNAASWGCSHGRRWLLGAGSADQARPT